LGLLYFELNQSQKAIKHLKSALKYYKKIKAVSEVEKIESLVKN